MNGYDYDYEANNFEFTFVGTGSQFGLGPATLVIFAMGLLVIAFILFVQNYFVSAGISSNESRAYTANNGDVVEHGAVLRHNGNSSSRPYSQSRGLSSQR
jgi:hypothetical protein